MARMVNIDGTLTEAEHARIPVFDRGFLYGDSVYEVVRTYKGRPFELQAHLRRLRSSAALLALALPWTDEELAAEIGRTVAAAGNAESYVRLIVTRGAGEIGLDPGLAEAPCRIIIVQELETPGPEVYEHGVEVALVGVRRNLREAVDPAAKTGNYLNNVLALRQARAWGAWEAIMLDHEGRLTEASTANLFLARDGELLTPPLHVGLLEGVTRRGVVRLAAELGVSCREAVLWPEDLYAAQEAFLTSTTRELVPVVRVRDSDRARAVGSGRPGPLTLRLLRAFRRAAAAG